MRARDHAEGSKAAIAMITVPTWMIAFLVLSAASCTKDPIAAKPQIKPYLVFFPARVAALKKIALRPIGSTVRRTGKSEARFDQSLTTVSNRSVTAAWKH